MPRTPELASALYALAGSIPPLLGLRAAPVASLGPTLQRRARRVRKLVATVQPTFILAARRVHAPAALQASTNPRLDLRGRVAPAAAAATTRRRRGRRAVSLAPPDRGENWAWNLQAFRILKRGCFPRMSELNVNFRL